MRRRGFIAVAAGAAAWPLTGRAQQLERLRLVGWLVPWPETDAVTKASIAVLKQALERLGWVEGKNIRIECRFAGGDPNVYNKYAAELVGLSPDVLLAGATPAVEPLRQQTRIIPIVFVNTSWPVELGFVQSLARPGGNITGFSAYDASIMGKWVQLLKEIAPGVTRVAVIFNPGTAPFARFFNRSIEAAAPSFGITVTPAAVHDDAEIEEAIAGMAREPGGGLIDLPESFSVTHRDVITGAALRHGLPLIGLDQLARAGGLMAYTFDIVEVHAQGASYIDHILRGANPADLPVQEPTKWSLIINLKTAKALGLTVPPSMLDLADEVIE
jgi:putative tryptophan/tyrosine transport system substrate-binding protein